MPAVCYFGVRDAFKAIFNSNILDNKRANDMVLYLRNSSSWEKITLSQAQSLANQGWFVVAGWYNSILNKSGHVVVIVPGTPINDKWNGSMTSLPNSMDCGLDMREKSQPLNKSFGRNKQSTVEFYKYK